MFFSSGGLRVANEITTEDQLRQVAISASKILGTVSEFCAAADYQMTTPRYAFYVELQNDIRECLSLVHTIKVTHELLSLAPSASTAPQLVHAVLSEHNDNYRTESLYGKINKPVVRVVRRGTFGEYREWRVRKDNIAAGQIKVPAVVYHPEILQFLGERVVQEFAV